MSELLKVREITIDTIQHKEFNKKEEELKLIRFYQNDLNSAKLLINVTHDKVVTDFSSAISVQIAFLKPDGKRVFQDVQNVNQMQGKYYVVLSTQTLIAYGNVIAQLRFTFPNNKVIETCMLAFTVDESIMSDDAMKSTNEFPVIQKAIEVGEKFKDVDFVPIIAAGELAKGALPKTGGTMTGNLFMKGTNAISQRFGAGATPTWAGWESLTDGTFRMMDFDRGRNVMSYDPVADMLNINRGTNVVKKADAYTDYWLPTGRTRAITSGTDLNTIQTSGAYAGNGLLNAPNGQTGYFYIEVLQYDDVKYCKQIATDVAIATPRTYTRVKYNDVWGAWQEIISSLGGTLTGSLNFAAAGQIQNLSATGQLVFGNSGLWINDTNGNFVPFQYRYSDKTLNLSALTTLSRTLTMKDTIDFDGASGGQIKFTQDPTQSSARGFMFYESTKPTVLSGGMGKYRNTTGEAYYMGWGANPWSAASNLTVSETAFTYKNKPVAMRDKDGRVVLTLTSEATNSDSSYLPVVTRRGNSVTLRMAISRNVGSASSLVTTLPVDMRPVDNLTHAVIADDNTIIKMVVQTNGEVRVFTTGKLFNFVTTYTVD
ncbi:BppU family phage baseplate upper protein [Bacillus thuringiensis]|uniref:BppU family phage baseplate upper protein n=1 Tax=Bacillus thuringiensis TaxID=1428 RepID=UPI002FFE724C